MKFIELDLPGVYLIENFFNGNSATYFISGPPFMIKSFKKFLLEKNVQESKVITDDWE